jgi:hypothetical protein
LNGRQEKCGDTHTGPRPFTLIEGNQKKQRLLKDYDRKDGQKRFAQTVFHRLAINPPVIAQYQGARLIFGFCATNMPASLATGHKSTSHAELKVGVVSGFPDPKQPSFIPDRGGEVN